MRVFLPSGMRLLFSSAHRLQLERFSKILFVAGIQSQVRKALVGPTAGGAELWAQNQRDYQDAVKLFPEAAPARRAAE